jgi:hypothetical protein
VVDMRDDTKISDISYVHLCLSKNYNSVL